jgi:hypothetical protein
MPSQYVNIMGKVARAKPAIQADGGSDGQPLRSGRYGEEWNVQVFQKSHALADEGSYFVAANPTSGTGVANQAAPTGAPAIGATDTKPFLVYQNTAGAGGVRTYFDYLRLRNTAPGTNGTAINFAVILDVANAGRVPTGYTAITPVNCNMDDGTAHAGTINAGAGTVSTTSSGRLFPNVQLRPVIPVIGDIYILSFGASEYGVGSLISSGTTICQQTFGYPPLIVGPGQFALFYLWLPAQSAASSYEFDLGFMQR